MFVYFLRLGVLVGLLLVLATYSGFSRPLNPASSRSHGDNQHGARHHTIPADDDDDEDDGEAAFQRLEEELVKNRYKVHGRL